MRFLLRRAAGALATLLATSLLTYLLLFLGEGDPAAVIVARRTGVTPNAAQIAQVRAQYGLDRPAIVQYFAWLGKVVRGDFGYSLRTGQPVLTEIGARLGATLLLAGLTTAVTVGIGLAIGLTAAFYEGSRFDQMTRLLAWIGVAIPNFWLAFLLILLFAVYLKWLPTHGVRQPTSAILPVVTLAFANVATLSQLTRSLLSGVRHQDYVRTAHAKGLRVRTTWLRHALPNVAAPLLTLIASQFASIATGAVIVESIFAWPGIGNFYLAAVSFRDIPVIQAMVLLFTALFVGINLLVDLAYGWFDPRIRLA
ncbi:MAG: ABC transporter permease [Caldilineaceae bacterium]